MLRELDGRVGQGRGYGWTFKNWKSGDFFLVLVVKLGGQGGAETSQGPTAFEKNKDLMYRPVYDVVRMVLTGGKQLNYCFVVNLGVIRLGRLLL